MDFLASTWPGSIDRPWYWLWAGSIAILLATHMIARLITWAGITITAWPARRARGKHWSEQARWTYPARQLGARCTIVVALPLATVAARHSRRIEVLPPAIMFCLLALAAWSGVIATRISLEHHFTPAMALTPRPRRAAWIVNASLWVGLIVIGCTLYGLVTVAPGPFAWIVLLCGAAVATAHIRMGWVWILWAMGVIRPAGKRLQAIVSRVGEQMHIKPNMVVEIGLPVANAVAYLPRQAIGVTDAALSALDDDEISSIAAHEAGHLSESRWVRAARATAPMTIGLAVAFPSAAVLVLSGPEPVWGYFLLWLLLPAWLLWLIQYRKLARRMEERADSLAKNIESAPGVYARGLEKIYATNMIPVMIRPLSRRGKPSEQLVHPELYDRLVASGATPDYPRPEPPPRWLARLGLAIIIAASAAGCYAIDQLAGAVASW